MNFSVCNVRLYVGYIVKLQYFFKNTHVQEFLHVWNNKLKTTRKLASFENTPNPKIRIL